MMRATDILSIIGEQKTYNVKQLAKKLEIQPNQLEEILTTLSRHDLIDYSQKTGEIALPKCLANIDKKIEAIKPATGEIILPKYQEIKIHDVLIGNYTKEDVELKIRVKAKQKEIAICSLT